MAKPTRVLLCPDCGSSRVDYEAGYVTGPMYHCQACGYVGALVLERDLRDVTREAEDAGREAP